MTANNNFATCLITSQIDTAPKHMADFGFDDIGLITSQIDTAPKPGLSPSALASV